MLTPCDLPVFILKLFVCKQVEITAGFLAVFLISSLSVVVG